MHNDRMSIIINKIIHNKKQFFAILLVASLVICTACGTGTSKKETTKTEATEESKKEKKTEEKVEEGQEKDESFDITLGFAGDFNLAETEPTMQTYHSEGDNLDAVIDPVFQEKMRSVDLMWINNEFAYSNRGEPMAGKMYTFCAPPENVSVLNTLGVDIAGLANNHVCDYGFDAMEDTFDTLTDAGIPYVGAGRNLSEAKSPVYLEAQGLKIAFVAASRAEKYQLTPQATDDTPGILRCYDNTLFLEEITEAAENSDYVVCLPHWGTEHSTVLEEPQKNGAQEYIDAGADVVIGAHPHILQGMDFYNDKPIIYSLGNFWFDYYTIDTVMAVLHISGTKTGEKGEGEPTIDSVSVELIPGTQEDSRTMAAATDEERRRIFDEIESYEPWTVTIDDDGFVSMK